MSDFEFPYRNGNVNDELGQDFWELHPDSQERVDLRTWIDSYAAASEAVVHAAMEGPYQQVKAEVAAAPAPTVELISTTVAPRLGTMAVTEMSPVIDLDAARDRRRSSGGGSLAGVRSAAR